MNRSKVIIFTRVSSTKQDVEQQIEATKKYALQLGYKERDFIYISGVGASAVKCNQLYHNTVEQLLKYVQSGEILAVVCWHLNRLARTEEYAIKIKNCLIENATQLHIYEPTLSLLNHDGSVNYGMELALTLFSTMAKQQIQELVSKSKRAKQALAEKNLFSGGGCTFGYEIIDKVYHIHEDNASIVREIFNLYLDGYSIAKIKKELIERRLMSSIDEKTVMKILHDKSYCGDRFKPSIIDVDTYNKVQQLIKQNSYGRTQKHYLFCNRLIKCECGSTFIVSSGFFYRCLILNKGHESRHIEQHSSAIRCKYMDGLIFQLVRERVEKQIKKDNKTNKDIITKKINVLIEKSIKLENDIQNFYTKYERIQEMYIDGDISKNEYNIKKSQLKVKENELRDKQEKNKLELEQLTDTFANKKDYNVFDSGNSIEVQRVIKQHIKVITFINNKITVTFNDNTIFECYYYGYRKHKIYKDSNWEQPLSFPIIQHNGETFEIIKKG